MTLQVWREVWGLEPELLHEEEFTRVPGDRMRNAVNQLNDWHDKTFGPDFHYGGDIYLVDTFSRARSLLAADMEALTTCEAGALRAMFSELLVADDCEYLRELYCQCIDKGMFKGLVR